MQDRAISYDIEACALGRLLVAATQRGVCHIAFGDGDAKLAAGLQDEFPWARLERDPGRLAPWIDALLRHLSGESRTLDLPLDVSGSRFQRRVWDAIAAIPYGETRAYSELAARIGQPTAARAVARACGANPVPIAVPCHRVVGRRGDLGGYRYGRERKRALLDREGPSTTPSNPPAGAPTQHPHREADAAAGPCLPPHPSDHRKG